MSSKKYLVVFNDTIEANSEEEAWDKLLSYLAECVEFKDVTVFDFKETQEQRA